MREIKIGLSAEAGSEVEPYVDEFKERFVRLLKKSECKLNQYVYDDSVKVDESETGEILLELLQNVVYVAAYVDLYAFFNQFDQWVEYEEMNRFLLWLQQYMDDHCQAYKDTVFVRNMDISTLKKAVEECYREEFSFESDGAGDEFPDSGQRKILAKVFRTLINLTINNNMSRKQVWDCSRELFAWSEETFECFWAIIKKNREELWQKNITERLNHLENEMADFRERIGFQDETKMRESHISNS